MSSYFSSPASSPLPTKTEGFQFNIPTPYRTVIASPTATFFPTPSLTPIPTATSWEPVECRRPSDDYSLINVNGYTLNQRTFSMLEYAATLYDGAIDITGFSITQGSYTDSETASFGTHSGGGAVDISVMQPGTYTVLYDDIEPLIHALRLAGFAAWLRDLDELYPGSPIHIHAIAIGDETLSAAAREQLVGKAGYFWGYDGLPVEEGELPGIDRHGGPVLCQWMLDMGYPLKP